MTTIHETHEKYTLKRVLLVININHSTCESFTAIYTSLMKGKKSVFTALLLIILSFFLFLIKYLFSMGKNTSSARFCLDEIHRWKHTRKILIFLK